MAIPELNFGIKDNRGNTPLHTAGGYFANKTTKEVVFARLIYVAAHRGFDFSTVNKAGKSVLHIAAANSQGGERSPVDLGCELLIDIMRNADGLNLLCNEGGTAFYYALVNRRFAFAEALSKAGADMMLCGDPTKNPVALLNSLTFEAAPLNKAPLVRLKIKMLSLKSTAEVKKNGTVLLRAVRKEHALFSKLPGEILTDIVSMTANPLVHEQKDAIAIIARTPSLATLFFTHRNTEKSKNPGAKSQNSSTAQDQQFRRG